MRAAVPHQAPGLHPDSSAVHTRTRAARYTDTAPLVHHQTMTAKTTRMLGALAHVDPVDEGVGRLQGLAWAIFAICLFDIPIREFLARGTIFNDEEMALIHMVFVPVCAISLVLACLLRFKVLRREKALYCGMVYVVLSCLAIAVGEHSLFDYSTPPPRVSLGVVAAILFPLTIRAVPAAQVATICLGSCMPMLAGFIALARGQPMSHPANIIALTIPNVVVGLLGLLAYRVVYQLGRRLRDAQEYGSYLLTEQIGQGGMGDVWRAQHQLLARPAAVKRIRPDVRGGLDEAREYFDREARATASLRSPHTVELFDFGVTRDGVFYYAMELLQGMDLKTLVLRFGPTSPRRTIHILKQICLSLAEAHDAGLLHRDLKPENVFLAYLGGQHDFVKVLDFGLAEPHTPRGSAVIAPAAPQSEGMVRGSPHWMPPELVLQHGASPRSDLYGVGCIAYWLLTGGYVFDGDDWQEQVAAHVHLEPTPVSVRAQRPVPEDLNAIVMQLLRKDPAARPAHAADLRRALESIELPQWTQEEAAHCWREPGKNGAYDASYAQTMRMARKP